MVDRFTEVTSESWISRLIGSLKSVLVGLVLFLASFVVLYWNEGRAVDRSRALAEAQSLAVEVTAERVDPAQEGKLILTQGQARGTGAVADPEFGVRVEGGLSLTRNLEMYQWVEDEKTETREKIGGGKETITTYTYSKEWQDRPIDSSGFRRPQGHQNPPASDWPFRSESFVADPVTLGAFEVPPAEVTSLPVTKRQAADDRAIGQKFDINVQTVDDIYYLGGSPGAPEVGDFRVSFTLRPPQDATLLGKQSGRTISAYTTSNGGRIFEVRGGQLDVQQLFGVLNDENATLTWILRLVGWVVMTAGLALVLNPIRTLAAIVPFFARIVGGGILIVSGLIALVLSLITIAISWIVVRPMIGIPLLVAAVALLILPRFLRGRQTAQPAMAGGPPPPPMGGPPPPPLP